MRSGSAVFFTINHLLCGWLAMTVIRVRKSLSRKVYTRIVQDPTYKPRRKGRMANQTNSLSHTKWLCKYHIVFTPKYRRKAIFAQYKESIGHILRQLCNYKGVEIIEGHLMIDHVQMLVSIPPKYSV